MRELPLPVRHSQSAAGAANDLEFKHLRRASLMQLNCIVHPDGPAQAEQDHANHGGCSLSVLYWGVHKQILGAQGQDADE
ncbi:hypothetical protein GUJ93_ZPchr0006g44251 [Zizania palustris]|uniref:Uncharacterized protein n=1 Tax=Zizania palustris TaxID=103762 RepID=A0A8J5T6D8_ZIZPA|nr:hypothetical protein GUJ93_ZPchr0006g44251 [Zizania palustris]